MNQWKTNHPNHNLNYAEYLIALAQYYSYGPQYHVFGGLYKVEIVKPCCRLYSILSPELVLIKNQYDS